MSIKLPVVFYIKFPVFFSVVKVVLTGLIIVLIGVVLAVKLLSSFPESEIIYSLGFKIPMAWLDLGAEISNLNCPGLETLNEAVNSLS